MLKKVDSYTLGALGLLAVMAGFLFYAAWHDNATMDESSHIPAGYSYVFKQDMRINPEHPPLVKFLSGIPPVLFLRNVHFPENSSAWQDKINAQWDFGSEFLYRSGNDAEAIVHAARIPAILLTLILGWFIWLWGKELVGPRWGLLPLSFFTLSPNFVGHGHLVTTDIGAALGVLISIYYFSHYLKSQTRRNLLIAGIALGIGLLLKFTVVFVVPVLIFMGFAHAYTADRWKGVLPMFKKLVSTGVVAALVLLLLYLWHVWHYPVSRQIRDADYILSTYGFRPVIRVILAMMRFPVLRAWAQYLLGFFMNLQRAAGGNTTYFLGEVSNLGWKYYFPLVYLMKEPIPILIVLAFALALGLKHLADLHASESWCVCVRAIIKDQIGEVGMILFIIGFWGASIASRLNIGVRHIFPTLPFMYLLAAKEVKTWVADKRPRQLAVVALVVWLAGEFLFIAPNFIAYFNEFIGGPKNAARYVVDSNLDWGQDLKRLRDFVVENNISKIKLDYFGGGDTKYYLGDRFEPLPRGPQKGWIAVSATFLEGGQGRYIPSLHGECCYYQWLAKYEPVKKIGYSIYVYHISE